MLLWKDPIVVDKKSSFIWLSVLDPVMQFDLCYIFWVFFYLHRSNFAGEFMSSKTEPTDWYGYEGARGQLRRILFSSYFAPVPLMPSIDCSETLNDECTYIVMLYFAYFSILNWLSLGKYDLIGPFKSPRLILFDLIGSVKCYLFSYRNNLLFKSIHTLPIPSPTTFPRSCDHIVSRLSGHLTAGSPVLRCSIVDEQRSHLFLNNRSFIQRQK